MGLVFCKWWGIWVVGRVVVGCVVGWGGCLVDWGLCWFIWCCGGGLWIGIDCCIIIFWVLNLIFGEFERFLLDCFFLFFSCEVGFIVLDFGWGLLFLEICFFLLFLLFFLFLVMFFSFDSDDILDWFLMLSWVMVLW